MSENKKDPEIIDCDFCDAEFPKKSIGLEGADHGWNYGMRGSVMPCDNKVCMAQVEVKHACPDRLCQAKLLVWTRT